MRKELKSDDEKQVFTKEITLESGLELGASKAAREKKKFSASHSMCHKIYMLGQWDGSLGKVTSCQA